MEKRENKRNNSFKEIESEKYLNGKGKYEIPSIMFVPVKIEERLMQGECSKTADGLGCISPFKFS